MAANIRIKRSGTSGNPSTLAQGELAYSYLVDNGSNGGDRLYVGTGTELSGDAANHTVIGGKYYVDLLGGEGGANFGTLTASQAIVVDSNKKIDEIIIDNITIDGNSITTSIGNLNLNPTGYIDFNSNLVKNLATPVDSADAANKSYVDSKVLSGVSFTISDGVSSDTFNPGVNDLTFTGGAGITTAVTDDQVTFSITNTGVTANTYGSSTQIPVLTINAQGQITSTTTANVATDFTFNGDTISLLDSDLSIIKGAGINVAYDSASNVLTISAEDATTTDKGIASFNTNDFNVSSGAIELKDTVVKSISGTTGTANPSSHGFTITGNTPLSTTASGSILTISAEDATTTDKGVASFNSDNFSVTSGAVSIKDGGVSNAELINSSITIGNTEVNLGDSITDISALTSLSVDNVSIDGNTISTTSGVMYLDPATPGSSGDVFILGNLTVEGTTTTINSTELSINDLNIVLADSATTAVEANGAGITVNGANATFNYSSVTDRWTTNKGLSVGGELFINGSTFSDAVDSSVADLLLSGEGIDLLYNAGAGTLTIAAELATNSNLGVASFDVNQFSVTSGAVSITGIDGGTY